jgi:transcriptional regulator with XRE-family HTH domain
MNQRELDPSASVPAFFGAELRHHRKAAGLTQEELGEQINYTGALIGMIETTLRAPTLRFAEACDRVLGTDGALTRMWALVSRSPTRYPDLAELEAAAVSIRSLEPLRIPDLLQTPEYARAVLASRAALDDIDQAVAGLMDRQRLLDQPSPPPCWFIIGEAALRCPVGSPEIMRDQLATLLKAADTRRTMIQIMPYDTGGYAGLEGRVTLLTLEEGANVGYLNTYGNTMLIELPEHVAACSHGYNMAIAMALPPTPSANMIRTAMEAL